MTNKPEIVTVDRNAIRRVLRFCLARPGQSAAEVENHVTAFLEYARALNIDVHHLFVAREKRQEKAAAACIYSPGRTAMILLPRSDVMAIGESTIAALVRRAKQAVFADDNRLLQSLVEEHDVATQAALRNLGFQKIALLNYLERPLVKPVPPPHPPIGIRREDLQWLSYSPESDNVFRQTVLDSYADSADCPTLCGRRDIGDILAGHKAAGVFDPTNWRILKCDGKRAACVLLAKNPLRPILEVVYMGVSPTWRRRAVGSFVIGTVLETAYRQKYQTVTLAVDSANLPGRRLYEKFGFGETARRVALIRWNDDKTIS
ncbi:MAG: GNAT family N-acetyltransferase [Phycisphaerae bacterium]|nr:GNAT family N-acetyltransferase [Phycisphaerae bacterium]